MVIYFITNVFYIKNCVFNRSNQSPVLLEESRNFNSVLLETSFKKDVTEDMIDAIEKIRIELDIPSIQLSIISKDFGKFNYVSGYANLENERLATLSTVYYLGSITKIYVQAMILKLEQANLISLDDSVSKYLNALSNNKDVKVKHLLDHSSGVYDPLLNKIHLFKHYFLGKRSSTEEILREVKKNKPYFAPGESRKYSNTGYVLLGLIVERITNKTFSTVLKEFFF